MDTLQAMRKVLLQCQQHGVVRGEARVGIETVFGELRGGAHIQRRARGEGLNEEESGAEIDRW